MKLLFATSIKTWGGGEEWMLSAAQGLQTRGHQVHVVAPPRSALLERADQSGLATSSARFRADLDPPSFATVFGLCRRWRPNALVLNMDRVLRVGGVAARWAGVPVILPRRGSEFPLKDGALYRFLYRRIATGMIVNSEATARTLVRNIAWRPRGRLHVLLNGLDLDRFANPRPRDEVRGALGVPQDAPVAIVIGELTTRKNADLLIREVPGAVASGHDLHVLLVGEGAERDRWQTLAHALGVQDRVHLLGFRRDIPDLLGAADLLVHPSRMEGFGYAVAEGMAAGLPVVASNVSSLPELVRDGETGQLFPPGDHERLGQAMRRYLESPALAREHGQRGQARARAEFSLERRLGELEEILESEVAAATRSD